MNPVLCRFDLLTSGEKKPWQLWCDNRGNNKHMFFRQEQTSTDLDISIEMAGVGKL